MQRCSLEFLQNVDDLGGQANLGILDDQETVLALATPVMEAHRVLSS